MGVKCPQCDFDNTPDSKFCKECGTQLKVSEEMPVHTKTLEIPIKELTTGSTFAGRYQIIEELGRGGMGKVYKVLDKEVDSKIALKLIKPEIAADEKTIERFRNELKIARDISQKNVCRMYDLNKEEGSYFITMEYVDGQDLKGLIRQTGQLAIPTTISIAKQICDGLSEAHRLGVIHRDLKPSNIMIDKDGNVRIMDFGIARSLKAKDLTRAGVIIGTPEYMSPEQVEGKDIDKRSDIYSLGIILYEMVTGCVPFEGDTPFTVGVKQKSEIPKDPKELNTQIHENLSHLILKCLEKDKEKRFQSVEEINSELTRIEQGISTVDRVVPKKKPITSKEITLTFGLKKFLLPTFIVIALVVAAVIICRVIPEKKDVLLTQEGKPFLAVMHFKNNTGDENLDYLRTMLSDSLIIDLSQSKYLRVLSGQRLVEILGQLNQLRAEMYSSDVLNQVAVQGGVNYILLGSYARMGDVFRIDVIIQDATTGENIGSERVEAKGEEDVFPKVDELTRRIKANFKLSEEEITGDLDLAIGKITTSSPEAYKYYIEGLKVLIDEPRRSINLLEKAIEIDPGFAMAHQKIAIAFWQLGLMSDRVRHIQKALELKDRISERERNLIQAWFYQGSEKTYDKAIDAYTRLLELYPEDMGGNLGLGFLYRDIEEWNKAIERYKVTVNRKENVIASYIGLANSYIPKGLYDKAREVLKEYNNTFSDSALSHRGIARSYIEEGNLDLALAEMDKAFLLDSTHYENFLRYGEIYLYRGNFSKAEEEYKKILEHKEPFSKGWGMRSLTQFYKLLGKFTEAKSVCQQGIDLMRGIGEDVWKSGLHLDLARLYVITGNFEEALKECDLAWGSAKKVEDLERQRRTLYMKGLVLLETGELEEARRIAAELKQKIEEGLNKKAIRLHHHLTGLLEMEEGNYSQAIEHFKEALAQSLGGPLTKRADFIDSLAMAYYRSGDIERARQEYERITTLTTGRRRHGDFYVKSFYNLGKLFEDQGNTTKAIENYEKFLSLWKDADLGIVEIEEAEARLAKLKN